MRKKASLTILILILFTFFLPFLLSIPPLKQVLISYIELKMKAKISIDSIHLSWFGPQKIKGVKFSTMILEGSLEQATLSKPLWGLKSLPYSMSLTSGQVKVRSQNSSIEQLNASIEGQNIQATAMTNSLGKTGNFKLEGTAVDEKDYHLTLAATQMPTEPIDFFLRAEGVVSELIGPTFNASAYASCQGGTGEFGLDLASNTARILLDPSYDEKTVTLRKPLTFKGMIPKKLSSKYLKKQIDFLDPIILSISNDQFSLPRNFSLKDLKIKSANINLGRITIHNQQIPTALASWLKAPTSKNQLDAWLTCCFFSLDSGILNLGRLDVLLAQKLHLCGWGSIDLIKDRINATLGIPSEVLASNFGLSKLSGDYVLQIPVTGTIEEPKADTNVGGTKIAALIASESVQKAGGQWGQLIGGIAGAATQVSQPDTPKPCQSPFPWQ